MTGDDKTWYHRDLPGGGYVQVQEDPRGDNGGLRAYVSVERRRDPTRRDGHAAPIIALAEGTTRQGVFHQLLEVASDNVAVARALLRWQSDGRARF